MKVIPIDPGELGRLRARGQDDHGNSWTSVSGGKGRPARCCLRRTTDDERVVLISYAPVRPAARTAPNGPYDEVGPVYVHAEECGGYVDDGVFPPAWRDHAQVLRAYADDGDLLHGELTLPDQDRIAIAERMLDEPGTAFVHVRSVGVGCFSFELRP